MKKVNLPHFIERLQANSLTKQFHRELKLRQEMKTLYKEYGFTGTDEEVEKAIELIRLPKED